MRRLARSPLPLAESLLLAVLAILLTPAPALAHDEQGEMTVTAAEQLDGGRLRVEVGIVYTNDGHPAEEATVTATLTGPSGEAVGPVPLERQEGTSLYRAEIEVPSPGAWTVALSATNPAATAETSIDVAARTTTPPTDDTAPPPDATTPATVADDEPGVASPVAVAADDDGGGGNGALLAAVVIAAVALVALVAWALVRRRSATQRGDATG